MARSGSFLSIRQGLISVSPQPSNRAMSRVTTPARALGDGDHQICHRRRPAGAAAVRKISA
jgi:hypothetical protein